VIAGAGIEGVLITSPVDALPPLGQPGRPGEVALLGKIFDEAGNRLTPSHAVKNRRRYRYYVSRRLVTGTSQDKPDGWRLPAPQIEKLVADEAIRALADRRAVTKRRGSCRANFIGTCCS
jgi:hypothetical protein